MSNTDGGEQAFDARWLDQLEQASQTYRHWLTYTGDWPAEEVARQREASRNLLAGTVASVDVLLQGPHEADKRLAELEALARQVTLNGFAWSPQAQSIACRWCGAKVNADSATFATFEAIGRRLVTHPPFCVYARAMALVGDTMVWPATTDAP
jgi:hypothetical protein